MKKLIFIVFVIIHIMACRTIKFTAGKEEQRDDTEFIQTLLDSSSSIIKIPAGTKPWIVRPLKFENKENKTLLFESGCVLLAKRGSFMGKTDFLLEVNNCKNVKIIGYGAVFKMRKEDYWKIPYKKSQWRHGLVIFKTENLTVEGLKIQSSGGDGVYIGQRQDFVCKDINLKYLTIEDNHRQGISVISVDGLLIDNCSIFGTDGHLPKAGIDFEPNDSINRLSRIFIKNSTFRYNKGPGILIHLQNLKKDSYPIDITVEDSVSAHNIFGLSIMFIPKGLKGQIKFINTEINGTVFIGALKDIKLISE